MTTILNFGHPLSQFAAEQLEAEVGEYRLCAAPVHLDMTSSIPQQVSNIVDMVDLTPEQWQTTPLLVVLPAVTVAAACVIAEVHGRSGQWPRVISLVSGADRVFTLGEVIDLAALRGSARMKR